MDVRRNFFTERAIKYGNFFTERAVRRGGRLPYVELLKEKLDVALSAMIYLNRCSSQAGLDDLRGLFQPGGAAVGRGEGAYSSEIHNSCSSWGIQ